MTDALAVGRYAAFTLDPAGGNPAGVVVADRLRPPERMQRIAADVGFSETAFVAPADGAADYDVRYFSPEREVPFCGHATIATGVALADRDPATAAVTFATRSGTVPVAIARDGGVIRATLTSPPAAHEPVAGPTLEAALATFGWDRGVLASDLAPAVACAGARHLLLPVSARATLAAMTYAFEELRSLMLREDWTTVAAVWREAPDRFHARNAFPVGGVVEDPATGAAAAALGGYLRDTGELTAPAELTILQGEDMGRPSVLTVEIPAGSPGIRVSGTAVAMP